jgi:hypothetical protein
MASREGILLYFRAFIQTYSVTGWPEKVQICLGGQAEGKIIEESFPFCLLGHLHRQFNFFRARENCSSDFTSRKRRDENSKLLNRRSDNF